MSCRDCDTLVAHCHDVLIVHADGSYECSGEEPCAGRLDSHSWVVSCAEAFPTDCCTEEMPLAA